MCVAIKWFEDSPDAGTKECICSYCEKQIDDIAVRAFDKESGCEARFHVDCYNEVSGLLVITSMSPEPEEEN